MRLTRAMPFVLAILAGLVSCPVSAQQSASPAGDVAVASSAGLRQGKLSLWVSTQLPSDPFWKKLVDELQSDYPQLQVEWKTFGRSAFLPALSDALNNGTAPDAVFLDNAAQQVPLVRRRAGRLMVGLPRHRERGWWMILHAAPEPKTAEAFLVWLEQPKNIAPPRPATQLLTPADQAAVTSTALQTVRALCSSPSQPPLETMDQQAAAVNWERIKPPQESKVDCAPAVLQTGGNARLAFVLTAALAEGEDRYGVLHSFFVLRRDGSTWKVLQAEPNTSLGAGEETVARFDEIGLNNALPQSAGSITLMKPLDGERLPRSPRPELVFEPEGGKTAWTAIESQYYDPGSKAWLSPRIDWVDVSPDPAGVTRLPAPFGIGMQPHRWRVWSVSRAGVVALSEWRTIDYTN